MNDIVRAIDRVLPKKRPIGHHEPFVSSKELKNITECLTRGIHGNFYKEQLTTKLGQLCGVEQVIPVSSGTAALQLALLGLGVKPGDEVLVPSLTFAACANAICHVGAIPHFIDAQISVHPHKLRGYLLKNTVKNPDGSRYAKHRSLLNSKTKNVISTLIVVDLLGCPADWSKISTIADEFGLLVVEDAAQALGATYGNQSCGSFGDAAILSFNNNKIVTGNGGGAVLTNDPWVAAVAWELSTTARLDHPWKVEHAKVAYNYRMGEVNAAIVCAQLDQLPEFLEAKARINRMYKEALCGLTDVEMIEPVGGQANYWLSSILLGFKRFGQYEEILNGLHECGIKARSIFTPLHTLPHFKDCPRDSMDYTDYNAKRIICLPSGVGLVK